MGEIDSIDRLAGFGIPFPSLVHMKTAHVPNYYTCPGVKGSRIP